MSDGTSHLRVLNAHTFAERQTIHVHDQGHSIMNLNDIEFVEGVIFANVWRTDDIAIICPSSGAILSWINLGGIVPQIRHSDSNAVLNGIAYDSNRKRLYVTGKRWPTLFEIRVDHLSGLYGASQPSGCTDVTKVAPAIVCTD
jgi:glutamine cyclotransferase